MTSIHAITASNVHKPLDRHPFLVSPIDNLKTATIVDREPRFAATQAKKGLSKMAKNAILDALLSDVAKRMAKGFAIAAIGALVGFLTSKGWIDASAATALTNELTTIVGHILTFGQTT